DTAAQGRPGARSGNRHDAARADESPRQDGVRDARRWQGSRRGDGLQRDVIRVACNGNASADRLAEILQPFRPGNTPITVRYANERIGGELELPDAWRVNPDDTLIERLREWLAPENVQVVY